MEIKWFKSEILKHSECATAGSRRTPPFLWKEVQCWFSSVVIDIFYPFNPFLPKKKKTKINERLWEVIYSN